MFFFLLGGCCLCVLLCLPCVFVGVFVCVGFLCIKNVLCCSVCMFARVLGLFVVWGVLSCTYMYIDTYEFLCAIVCI